jgi:hypothetical protein
MSDQPVIFMYSYNCGGLADMIKGSSTAWFIAQQSKRPFQIQFHHSELATLFPLHSIQPFTTKPLIIKMIDKKRSDNILDIANHTRSQPLILFTNTCLDFFDSIPDYLEILRPYFEDFYTTWLPIQKTIPVHNEYQVLHVRMGDLYLHETTNKSDNRIQNLDHFHKCLHAYKEHCINGLPTLICSDHKSTRDKLLDEIPNSFVPDGIPYHFAYNTKKQSTEDIIESTRHTIQEHELMSRGKHIHMFSYSGFPIIASLIGHIPIYLMKPDHKDGFIPYISHWTP